MPRSRFAHAAALLFLLPALLLSACGGGDPAPTGSGSVTPDPIGTPARTTLTLRVFLPAAQAGLAQNVSSLRVQLGTLDRTLTLKSTDCTVISGGQSCAFTLQVAAGAGQLLTVSAYDAANRLIGAATRSITVLAEQDNLLALTLSGTPVMATVTTDHLGDITAGPAGSLLLDLGGHYAASFSLQDAAGQTILAPDLTGLTVSSSNPAFTVSRSGTTLDLTVPDPSGSDQSNTLSLKDAGGTVLYSQVVTVPALKLLLGLSSTAPVAGSSLLATARLTSARGRPLTVSGRTVSFSASSGSVPAGPTALTDASGSASLNVLTGGTVGTGTVSAVSDGVTASASYSSVAGSANTTTSSVQLSPDAVKVNGASTLSVTLKDGNGNPVTTPPTVTVSGQSRLELVTQTGNVFSYAVTAAASPETASFSVRVGTQVVGAASLVVTPYPLGVSDGAAALVAGSQYDFTDGKAHTFMASETGYAGAYSASSSNPAAATVSVSGGSVTVTPSTAAGFSTVTVTDTNGQSFSFTVSTTAARLIIN